MAEVDGNVLRLTKFEARFARAVERAETFSPRHDELEAGATIRGKVLRAIILGTALQRHDPLSLPWHRRPVQATRYGIRIKGPGRAYDPASLLRITGEFDLRDIAAANGGFLSPLEFHGCMFEEGLQLTGSRLQSLTLCDTRFPVLRADGADVAGSIRIHTCGPINPASEGDYGAADFCGWPEGDGISCGTLPSALGGTWPPQPALPEKTDVGAACEVSLRGASIGVGLEIWRCSLRAAEIRPASGARSMRDVAALELSHAHIRDRVELVRSTFIGGARFVGTAIGDDLWIFGGKFIALANRYALDFQFARIVGQLGVKGDTLKADERPQHKYTFLPVVVIGQFSAIGLSAGEVWIAGGFFHGQDHDENGSSPTLNFSKSNIRRTFKLGLYHPHYYALPERCGDRVYIHGELSLVAATIGKNLEIHGARAGNIEEQLHLGPEFTPFFMSDYSATALFKVGGEALKVDRRTSFTNCHFRAGSDSAAARTAAALSSASATSSAIDLFKATIGTGLKIKDSCTCDGAVRLNSCIIGREAIIGCRIINAPPKQTGSSDGIIPWLLDLRESTINGHLKIGRRSPPEDSAVTIAGGITLESAKVKGGATLRRLTLDVSGFPARPGDCKYEGMDRDRVALNLRDFVCGSDFEVHRLRWKLPLLSDVAEPASPGGQPVRGWRWPFPHHDRFADVERLSHAIIDLRGFRCGLLSDDFGDGWGLIYRLRLRLASFHIEEVEAGSDDRAASRLRWLAFQNRMQRISIESETPPAVKPSPPAESANAKRRWSKEWPNLLERFHCSRADDFVRHAYDAFASANSRAGEERAAEEILVERKNIQATLRFFRARQRAWKLRYRVLAAVSVVASVTAISLIFALGIKSSTIAALVLFVIIFLAWPICLGVLQLVARYFFRYGFSPPRALVVLAGCIVVGAVGVHYARYGGFASIYDWRHMEHQGHLSPDIVLVLEVPYLAAPVQTAAQITAPGHTSFALESVAKPEFLRGAGTRLETKLAFAEPSPCNLDVSSFLYAADLFIPVLDLDQESRCAIRHADLKTGREYTSWRIAKALYELLGWIVTSLVILILTGVLRRDLERSVPSRSGEEMAA